MAQVCVKQSEFVAHGSNVNAVALTPYKARMLATGGEDRKIAIWAIGKTQPILRIDGHTSPIESVAFSISEQYVAAGSKSGTTKVFDLEHNRVVRTLRGHKTSIKCLNFHGNGDIVVTGSVDTNIKIWDLRRKGCVYTYKAHSGAITSVQFSPDGRWIASGSVDGTAKLWDVGSSKALKDFTLHTNEVTSVKFHPNELLLATASLDRTLQFWDLETLQLISSTSGEAQGIRCTAFHADGQSIFSGAQDSLRVYNWEPEPVCCDAVPTGWGKVDDMVVPVPNTQQLISVSHDKSLVSVWVTNLEKLKRRGSGGPRVDVPSQPSGGGVQRGMSASGRQQFNVQYIADERPPTGPSRPKEIAPHHPMVEASLEDGDDEGPEADEEERKIIFHHRNTFVRTPPKHVLEQFIVPVPSKQQPSMPEKRELNFDADVKKPPHKPKPEESMGLNLEQFMPQSKPPPSRDPGHKDMDEEALLRKLMKDSSQLCTILSSRLDNLQLVRRDWSSSNAKAAMESVIALGEKSVLVDMLTHVFCRKQSFWDLNLCLLVLPELKDLITDKNESYVRCGCNVIKMVIKLFGPVIRENIQGSAPVRGIDISQEERYEKCRNCYSHLMSLKDEVFRMKTMSDSIGRLIRDLKNAFSRLE